MIFITISMQIIWVTFYSLALIISRHKSFLSFKFPPKISNLDGDHNFCSMREEKANASPIKREQ